MRGQPGEDHQPDHRVDQVAVRDAHEDQHDAEQDERDERPEAHPGQRGEVPPGGVAGRAEACDEQGGGPAGLPQRPRVLAGALV